MPEEQKNGKVDMNEVAICITKKDQKKTMVIYTIVS